MAIFYLILRLLSVIEADDIGEGQLAAATLPDKHATPSLYQSFSDFLSENRVQF